ncbi:erythromycin esterase family protein [Myroides sp. N17-2]|uniref:erythromycin esterase family protein n=1 Tax=Myroides sp. N17-2 TaxID=2030799 RepID=UPI000EFA9051|nr:erythromycin esterase family protein [Myroides sp. N17-2]
MTTKPTIYTILFTLVFQLTCFAQLDKDLHPLNTINEELLTPQVKEIIAKNVNGNKTIFLGEADHQYGSDLKTKFEILKYLVLELSYKDVVFEADFFALSFIHSDNSLYKMWRYSDQIWEMATFMKDNNVTIYGMDNKLHTKDSYTHFIPMLQEYLSTLDIILEDRFISLSKEVVLNNGFNNGNKLTSNDIEYLNQYISKLLTNESIIAQKEWKQILESYISAANMYYNRAHDKKYSLNIDRDIQMASNLDFIVKNNPEKKFVVWLANAHMSKINEGALKCGNEFIKKNPNTTYHIAISSYPLFYKNEKSVQKAHSDKEHLISILPSTESNYFLDIVSLFKNTTSYTYKNYKKDMTFTPFQVSWDSKKQGIFQNFDAMIFISEAEKVSYIKYDQLILEKQQSK